MGAFRTPIVYLELLVSLRTYFCSPTNEHEYWQLTKLTVLLVRLRDWLPTWLAAWPTDRPTCPRTDWLANESNWLTDSYLTPIITGQQTSFESDKVDSDQILTQKCCTVRWLVTFYTFYSFVLCWINTTIPWQLMLIITVSRERPTKKQTINQNLIRCLTMI